MADSKECGTCGRVTRSQYGYCSAHRKDSPEYRAFDAEVSRRRNARRAAERDAARASA